MKPLNLIHFYRQKIGVTQAVLALNLEVSIPTLKRWETGVKEPSLLQLMLVSKTIGVPVKDLINWREINKL